MSTDPFQLPYPLFLPYVTINCICHEEHDGETVGAEYDFPSAPVVCCGHMFFFRFCHRINDFRGLCVIVVGQVFFLQKLNICIEDSTICRKIKP